MFLGQHDEAFGLPAMLETRFYFPAQILIATAGPVKEGFSIRRWLAQGLLEYLVDSLPAFRVHSFDGPRCFVATTRWH
jgi:hypothetical protein